MGMPEAPEAWRDEVLALRCVAREEAAWRELLRRAGPAARAMLQRVFSRAGLPEPAREAEEALGDLVAALLEKDASLLRAYRPVAPLKAYVAMIARSLGIKLVRKRRPSAPLADVAWQPPPEEDWPGPEQLALALPCLAPRERLLLRLVYWDALTYAQAAEVLGVSPESVGQLLTRARSALREALEKNP